MLTYSITCRDTHGRHVWSVSQDAPSPALAIAQATLPPSDRPSFAEWYAGTEDCLELKVPHPCGGPYTITAEAWPLSSH